MCRRFADVLAGENSNSDLNDRHDVQYEAQSRIGVKVECTYCHEPHVATSSALLKSDPDPGDGRATGTGQILAGADYMIGWRLDCHDGSLPGSVPPPSTPLEDVRYAFQLEDSHGPLSSRGLRLKDGHGWVANDLVPCLACQTLNHISSNRNLFQVKDVVKSKDGTLGVPSDSGSADELTNNNIRDLAINGYQWCNTCHTASMGDEKAECFNCHYHGERF